MHPDKIAANGSETAQQKALFAFAAMARLHGFAAAWLEQTYERKAETAAPTVHEVPQLTWLHAIPNGGKRDAVTAARLRAEGVRSGIADVFWPHAVAPYHGLYIEMKVGNNKPSPEQAAFLAYARKAGYACAVAYDWREAGSVLQWYYAGMYKETP